MNSALNRVGLVLGIYLVVASAVLVTSGKNENYRLVGEERQGLGLYRQHNCMTCHSTYGVGGHIGPDLTNTASRFGYRYMFQTIRYGRGKMPGYPLDKTEIDALIRYLEKVNDSGTYPVRDFPGDYFGRFDL